jgi:hypothetical protein
VPGGAGTCRGKRTRKESAHRLLGFKDSEAYLKAQWKMPWDRWMELEQTYHYVARCRPDLFKGTYSEAKQEMTATQQRQTDAAEKTTGAVLPRGGDQRSEESEPRRKLRNDSSQAERAKSAGISKRQQENLDALARRAPNLHDAVKAGEISVHSACVRAGIVKVPTALEVAKRAWFKLSGRDSESPVAPGPWQAQKKAPGVQPPGGMPPTRTRRPLLTRTAGTTRAPTGRARRGHVPSIGLFPRSRHGRHASAEHLPPRVGEAEPRKRK